MFSAESLDNAPVFEIIGSNISQVASFGSDMDSSYIQIYANTTSNVGFLLGTSNINSDLPIFNIGQINTDGVANCNLIIMSNQIGIGTSSPEYTLHVEGKVYAADSITSYSDSNMKTDIKTINNALEKVELLRGVEYRRKDTNEKHIGVIAQETLKIIPEVVSQTNNGYSVAYGNMVGLLIEAIKDLNIEIKQLKSQMQQSPC